MRKMQDLFATDIFALYILSSIFDKKVFKDIKYDYCNKVLNDDSTSEIGRERYNMSTLVIKGRHITSDYNDKAYVQITISKMYDAYDPQIKTKEPVPVADNTEYPIRVNIQVSVNTDCLYNEDRKYGYNGKDDTIDSSIANDGFYMSMIPSNQDNMIGIAVLLSKSFMFDYSKEYNGDKFKYTLAESIDNQEIYYALTAEDIVDKTMEVVDLCQSYIDDARKLFKTPDMTEPDYRSEKNNVSLDICKKQEKWWRDCLFEEIPAVFEVIATVDELLF